MNLTTISFSGHESFAFRNTWLTKGLKNSEGNPDLFHAEDAMAILGVGKNMVSSIRHWCTATKLLVEYTESNGKRIRKFRPSKLGECLFINTGENKNAWDPYFEDPGTLWLIHWLLTTNTSKATTWYYAFNHIHKQDFSRESLEFSLLELANRFPTVRSSRNTIKRDIDVFIRSYVRSHRTKQNIIEETLDCPLVELNLIKSQRETGRYSFNRGPQDGLPIEVFLYALLDYSETSTKTSTTLSFEDIAYGIGSPGKVFKIDEISLSEILEQITELTKGAVIFSETAGLKQIIFKKSIDKLKLLSFYFTSNSCQAMFRD